MSADTKNSNNTLGRRAFMRTTAQAGAALLGSSLIATTYADELPTLQEDDPIAVALGYKADATTVDTAKYPKRAGAAGAKQFCSNCTLYQATSDTLGKCTAIPGKLVAGAGWCQAWVG